MAILSVKQEVPKAFKLRAGDELECLAFGISPEEGVHQSIELSDYWEGLYIDDEFAGAWGYARQSLFSATCWAWLLTTDLVTPHRQLVARQSIRNLQLMFQIFHDVEALVHEDYALSRKWLDWLGFTPIGAHAPYVIVRASREDTRWLS